MAEALHVFGTHIFKADVQEHSFDPNAVIVGPQLYEDYVAYQELGTVIGEKQHRTYRTTLTKVPPMLFHEVVAARAEVGREFEKIVTNLGAGNAKEAAAAGIGYAHAMGHYGRVIEATLHVPDVDRAVFYHDKNLLTPELASETQPAAK